MTKVLLAVGLLCFSAAAFAEAKFYKKSARIIFAYEEFRKLSAAAQEEWMQEMHNFSYKVDVINSGYALKKDGHYGFAGSLFDLYFDIHILAPRFCSALQTFHRLSVAQAASATGQCQVLKAHFTKRGKQGGQITSARPRRAIGGSQ